MCANQQNKDYIIAKVLIQIGTNTPESLLMEDIREIIIEPLKHEGTKPIYFNKHSTAAFV